MPASETAFQKGSNSGRPKDRVPRKPGTGAGRTSTVRAPRSSTHSSSSSALSTIGSVMTGVAKELGQRFLRLVEVVVRVEDRKAQIARRHEDPSKAARDGEE